MRHFGLQTIIGAALALSVAPPATAQRAPTRAPTPAAARPLILEDVNLGFHCGNCASDPVCNQRWIDSVRPTWDALVRGGSSRKIHLASGTFGVPTSHLSGPAWTFELVLPGTTATGTVRVQVGPITTTATLYPNSFGWTQGRVLVFQSQLAPGAHAINVTAPDGTLLLAHRATFLATQRP
ncbi:MAG: hypothetical protein JNK05_38180 [Myxococcales bacterium]|nr:hypothetical protein [Myxococcales bacterium]